VDASAHHIAVIHDAVGDGGRGDADMVEAGWFHSAFHTQFTVRKNPNSIAKNPSAANTFITTVIRLKLRGLSLESIRVPKPLSRNPIFRQRAGAFKAHLVNPPTQHVQTAPKSAQNHSI
jgi:hypothetical protein